jgi:hypothetical protein
MTDFLGYAIVEGQTMSIPREHRKRTGKGHGTLQMNEIIDKYTLQHVKNTPRLEILKHM